MVETNLYFGQHKLDGGIVSQPEWDAFVRKYISKTFRDGSTIISATGNWYDTASKQIITEPVYLVVAVNRMSPHLSKQIDSLRYWYKSLLHQQSVLRVDKRVKAKLF
jgi:hypothetical protein